MEAGTGVRLLVVASNNKKKLTELNQILREVAPTGSVRLVSAAEANLGEPIEDGETFVDNVLIKALAAYRQTGEVCVADDSGLEVDHLAGRPGVHSARFAGPTAKDTDNNRLLMELMAGVPEADRGARYRCVIAVVLPPSVEVDPAVVAGLSGMTLEDGARVVWADGAVEGRVLEAPRGEGGFGYDPYILYPPSGLSFAELPAEVKNRISHRGQALAKLRALFASLV
ncbi:MAG TPA: non-canonical purine NTP pyrophosphatase [Myxococcota bacterium]|nr:non-canonical purine NTP pyrophosphatase [Myxococcota bacterium]